MPDADSVRPAPDPCTAANQTEFRELLRQLMRSARHSSLQQLNAAALKQNITLPVSTADRALNADRLPTADFVRRFVATCNGDVELWLAARDALADRKHARQPGPRPEAADRVPVCPYPGLAEFTPEAARWFFGREHATAELISHLTNGLPGDGPLVVTAPSGTGKSSLLRAGLIPALRRGALPGSQDWPIIVLTPSAGTPDELVDKLNERLAVERAVIVVDQLEEIFTLWSDEEPRRGLLQILCTAAADGHLVVLGLRADFYGHCAAYPELLDSLRQGQMLLGAMTAVELRTAIEQPARTAGLTIEPGLVDVLLADLGATGSGYQPGALPLLSHATSTTSRLVTCATRVTIAGLILTIVGFLGIVASAPLGAFGVLVAITVSHSALPRRAFMPTAQRRPEDGPSSTGHHDTQT